MRSRLFLSFLMTLFIASSMFAGTPLEDKLVLKGEFSQISGRTEIPITANITDNAVCVEFADSLGDVAITIKDANKRAYASAPSIDVDVVTSGQTIAIPIENYNVGTYIIEFSNSDGDYVYGEFTIM